MADITVTAAKVGRANPDTDLVVPVILYETMTAGQAAYIDPTTGRYGIADANASGKQQIRGVVLEGGGAGQCVPMMIRGYMEGFTVTSMSFDDLVYLSDTAGALSTTNGTMTVRCGRIVSLTQYDPAQSKLKKVIWLDCEQRDAWS